MGEGRFAEARRAIEENVVDGLGTIFGGSEGDVERLFQPWLADEFG